MTVWLGVILYGVVAMNAAGIATSAPRLFASEDACSAWTHETIDAYVRINSTKEDPSHQVLAAGFCVVAPERDA